MTCHMVQVENNLGRSLVIDLKSDSDNKFRQIDHRTIESIVFKNVKYVLKKGGKSFADIDTQIPKDEAKWDASQLKVGNVFSGTSYYETVSDMGSEVFCYEKNMNDRGLTIDKSILRDEMHNACVWDEEMSISKTELATKLTEANNMCFQVNFTTKPNTPGKFIVWFRNETTLLVLWQPPYPAGYYTDYKVSIKPEDANQSELYVQRETEPPGPAQVNTCLLLVN